MLKDIIKKLVEGFDLTLFEAEKAMNCIMEGSATGAQIGSFITALRMKGETIDEITGCARVMRQKAVQLKPDVEYYIDTCGTGGDRTDTFNISTAAAFVASAGGVHVAKHGNRSVSSMSGSADVLEALGINIELTPEQVTECIEKIGIGFMFAPSFHKSMKYAAGPRKELGLRTVFNILGPLTNPANAPGQVLGVFDDKLTEQMAGVLLNLGVERAMVVHGMDGMDEITVTGNTKVSEIKDGKQVNYVINPENYGIKICAKEELSGGDAVTNSHIIKSVFNGEISPRRDIVLLNAAASLYVGKISRSISDGYQFAAEIVDSGKAKSKLEEMKNFTLKYKNEATA